jgi:predicted RNA-binding protein Jag
VPTRAVARILGKGGAQINQIKDETNAQIDIDKASEVSGDSNVTNIVVRGTKDAINSAKDAIMAIANEVDDETILTVHIDNKFHGTIIGAGGQGLKDLIAKVGGPSDNRGQAGLIHLWVSFPGDVVVFAEDSPSFSPRQGDPGDEVRLRGPRALVTKLQTELEKIAANLKDRVILGVSIPASHHRTLIGRGGLHLNQLQDRTNTTIYFPGSRSYNQVGEVENVAELGEGNPQDLVKVIGSREACEKAIKELEVFLGYPVLPANFR